MELKDFVKKVLVDLVEAVDGSRQQSTRDMHLTSSDHSRTVEFDIAVTAEDVDITSGKAGVKVLHFVEAGGDISKEVKNSTVSRIKFGVQIDAWTKVEADQQRTRMESNRRNFNKER